MRRVGLRGPGRVVAAHLPGPAAHVGIGDVHVVGGELLSRWIPGPDALRAAVVRNPRVRRDAGAGKGRDGPHAPRPRGHARLVIHRHRPEEYYVTRSDPECASRPEIMAPTRIQLRIMPNGSVVTPARTPIAPGALVPGPGPSSRSRSGSFSKLPARKISLRAGTGCDAETPAPCRLLLPRLAGQAVSGSG